MICIIAIIDSASRERFLEIQRVGEEFGIPSRYLRGHITLITYLGSQEEEFIASCKSILSGYHTCSADYQKLQILAPTPSIVAIPEKKGPLAEMQRAISECWEKERDQWTKADVWVPHTTLLYKPETDLEPIVSAMREKFEPFSAQIEMIEFSKVCENGYEILDTVYLNR